MTRCHRKEGKSGMVNMHNNILNIQPERHPRESRND